MSPLLQGTCCVTPTVVGMLVQLYCRVNVRLPLLQGACCVTIPAEDVLRHNYCDVLLRYPYCRACVASPYSSKFS